MSLIPYNPQEGREIVLRHRNAIVVRDSTSHRLELRGLTECPACHRPLTRSASPERAPYNANNNRPFDSNPDSYLNPDYFRMLQAGTQASLPADEPASPVRRQFRPALGRGTRGRSSTPETFDIDDAASSGDAEFVSSTPDVPHTEGTKIRKQAFSPGYFKTFFKEEKVLGRGGKGVVLLVRHELDNCDLGYFACKRVPVGDDHQWLERVLVEVGLLNKLTHPNLVSYRHVWLESVRLSRFGPHVPCAFILQQYCNGGDLQQYLVGGAAKEATKEELKARARRRSKGQAELPDDLTSGIRQLSLEEIYSLFRDITSGVAYLHSNGYIHRDLKPNNCLLNREGQTLRCLISDFGEVQAENVVRKSTGTTGTISYCAPEVLKVDATGRYGNFTTKSDMFSLGMILYFICFGKLPYRSANAIQEELEDVDELRAEIAEWQGFQDAKRERPDLPPRLYTLLRKLLSLNPTERPGANDVLSAMRGENPFDMSRGERSQSPSLGLHGHRVQNLDSPAVPSTPVPEPHKHFARARNDSSRPGSPRAPMFENPTTTSASRQSSEGSQMVTTTRFRPQPTAMAEASEEQSGVYEESSSYVNRVMHEEEERRMSRPLLMPPRRSRAAVIRDNAKLALMYLMSVVGMQHDMVNHLFRISFFLLKLVSIMQPCWPYTTRLGVSVPLIMFAALDLRVPDPSTSAMARQTASGEIEFGPARLRGVGWSIVLLALHLVIVWVMVRWDALCVVTSRDIWESW